MRLVVANAPPTMQSPEFRELFGANFMLKILRFTSPLQDEQGRIDAGTASFRHSRDEGAAVAVSCEELGPLEPHKDAILSAAKSALENACSWHGIARPKWA